MNLRGCDVLRQVNILGTDWQGYVGLFLRLNQLERHYLIESRKATREDLRKVIIYPRNDEQIVHYLLSKNPALCLAAFALEVEERPRKRRRIQPDYYEPAC